MRAARIVVFVLFAVLSTTLVSGADGHQGEGILFPHRFELAPPAPRVFSPAQLPGLFIEGQSEARGSSRPLYIRYYNVPPTGNLCYTARSYLYARESRDSDVTRPVGYRICTPATKFQVKSADLPSR